MRTGLGCQRAVEGVANTGRQYLCLNVVFFVHGNYVFNEVYSLKTDIIQPTNEGAYCSRTCLSA